MKELLRNVFATFSDEQREVHPMMTEQELNNLIRGKAQASIPSIVQEIVRLSQALEQKAHELESLHAGLSKNGKAPAQN
jgi:hypothetical protein